MAPRAMFMWCQREPSGFHARMATIVSPFSGQFLHFSEVSLGQIVRLLIEQLAGISLREFPLTLLLVSLA